MEGRSVGSAAARVIVGLIVMFMIAPAPSRAALFTVNSLTDSADVSPGDGICADGGGLCTLRAAIMETNALSGTDTITLPAGTYNLTLTGGAEPDAAVGDLDVTDDLTLHGAGASVTTVDAAGIDRVLEASGVESPRRVLAAVLEGLTLTGGITGNGGGGLRAQYAALTLNNCVVRSCHASDGAGGVHLVTSSLKMEGGAIRDNTTSSLNMCSGGLFLSDSSAALARVEVAGNGTVNYGGGITLFQSTSSLSLTECTLTGNSGSNGGGLLVDGGVATALRTAFAGNSSWAGGGIDNYGTLTLRDCAVTGNSASASGIYFGGGGIANHGTLALDGVEVSGNQAPSGTGGGILEVSWGADATWTNLTCDGNSAAASTGGCLHYDGTSFLTLVNATVTDNAAPAGGGVAAVTAGTLRLLNSIVAGNAGGNCEGGIVSLGHNLEDGTECGFAGTGDLKGIDPLLGALTDNGGPGRTRALLPGSPALDSAASEGAPDRDGRGQRRPRDGNLDGIPAPDRGAWEYSQTETSRTGQTTVYAPGDDASLHAGLHGPSPRFLASDDGTLLDRLTGLAWAADATAPAVDTCTGGAKTWEQCLGYVNCLNAVGYLGHSDWRLPNANELVSLANTNAPSQLAWMTGLGFIVPGSAYGYWSSTPFRDPYPDYAYILYALGSPPWDASLDFQQKHVAAMPLPVRTADRSAPAPLPRTGWTSCSNGTGGTIPCAGTGQDGDTRAGVPWPPTRFSVDECGTSADTADDVITDHLTGLMWPRDWQGRTYLEWAESLAAADSLVLCGRSDWRIPNLAEALSLFRSPGYTPDWLASQGFLNLYGGSELWTSTTYPMDTARAFLVSPDGGRMFVPEKSSSYIAFPVRGNATLEPSIRVQPGSVAFGTLPLGSSQDRTITVANDGTGPLHVGSVGGADPVAGPFSIIDDACSSTTVAAGGSCTFGVSFQPAAEGSFLDTLSIASDDPLAPLVTVGLDGTGAAPAPLLLEDHFDHAAGADPDWTTSSGGFSVTPKEKFTSTDTRQNNLALAPGLDLPALRIQARVKLVSPDTAGANASLVFGAQSAASYRYVKIKPGKIVVGVQGGSVIAVKSKSIAPSTWYALRVDVYADGRVEVFLGSPAKMVLSTTFGSGAGGGVGLAVSKGKSLFDDVFVWNGSVLVDADSESESRSPE